MKNIINVCLLSVFALGLAGCKPVKLLDPVEIKPNETAWAIPLDGNSQAGQVKFNSVEFLNSKKVSAKRYMVDKVQRQTGRFYWQIEWIPATRIVKVDRSLVTREWTDTEDRGTSKKSEGIPVNTKDNIGLTIGLTITTCVEEDDASTYLYYHGETPLAVVTDQNIRSFAVAELNRVVSSLTLVEFQQQQANIYTTLFKDTAEYYKTKGVTVQYLGNAEGWRFSHKEIQDGINKSFLAQQDNKTAEMEQQATKTRNQTKIMNQENDNKIKVMAAQAEVDAAKKLQEAKDAAEFQNQLKIALITAQARATMADKWNGSLPANILPSNSPLLLSLGENNVSTNHVR